MKKTTLRQNVTNTDRQWWIVDAEGKTLGQLAVKIADVLRGKNRPDFTPHVDGGDYVIVVNAEKVRVTGAKETDKMYHRHSGYIGNLKSQSLGVVREKHPTRILEKAVSGMLPKTRLRSSQMKRLILVVGSDHAHTAQQPKPLEI